MFVSELTGVLASSRSRRVLELLAEREQLESELLDAMAEWIDDRAWEAAGSASPVAWISHRAALPRRTAAALVASASLVRRHARVREALSRSTIHTAHVASLARASRHREDVFAEHVDVLVDAAESVDPEQFRTVTQRWCAYADDHLGEIPAAPHRWLDVAVTFQGSVRVDGLLDPEGGATLLAALAAHEEPPRAGDPRSAATRRADALIALAGGTRPTINLDVVVDTNTLTGTAPHDPASARHDIDRTGPARPTTIRRLACDAAVGRVVMGSASEILNLGRRTRLVSNAQRRALAARDGGCSIDGCDRPPEWCDAHHILHWAEGGATDLDNLVLLCRHHHTHVHEQRGRLVRGPGGRRVVEPP